jgi:hypothetical protein
LYFVAAVAAELVLLFFGLIFALIGGFAVADLVPVATVLVGIALLLFSWLLPVPAMLAYGSKLVSYQASAAERAFERIEQAFDRHATPRDSFQVRSLSLPGEGRRDYLELRYGVFVGYISCFPHGKDLYMSWTFWIYMSPFRLGLMRIGRVIQSLKGRGNDLYQTLRYESVRATVGAIQTCAVEGIEVAIGEVDGGKQYSLAGDLPVPIS